ncbi:MAG: DUF1343 domain-containing protein [Taibaiella sp.]|nr:DUF1343 domain-containing protein [Taibaiella sp.]
MTRIIHLALLLLLSATAIAKNREEPQPAAETPSGYLQMLAGKRVAVVVNQTSTTQGTLLPDLLLSKGINLRKIFVPEHGFRGTEDAGAHIENGSDKSTGLPVISLYGKNKKPTEGQLADIDILVYDLQDVGVRFYTYISTMEYCMEACAAHGKKFLVLDRPNPNGFYVDGPILEQKHSSFVGMQAVPIVYGMTAGEYAQMLKGEKWIDGAESLDLEVIKCTNYDHRSKYKLPVPPSPNLKTMEAIYAYPSLCLFEGTVISMGRGTDMPFRQYGCPEFSGKFRYTFTPHSMQGAAKPPYEGKQCYGELVAGTEKEILQELGGKLRLHWLIKAFKQYPTKAKFFTSFFTSLAGTETLRQQIEAGKSEKEIRDSWQPALDNFNKVRKKYLLYRDF